MSTTQNASSTRNPNPVTAFVMKDGGKFVCVINQDRISTSKYPDYVEYHLKRGDVKSLTARGIEKIAYVGDNGAVDRVVEVTAKVPEVTEVKEPEAVKVEATKKKVVEGIKVPPLPAPAPARIATTRKEPVTA